MKAIDRRFRFLLLHAAAGALLVSSTAAALPETSAAAPRGKAPTAAEAKAFVEEAEARLLELYEEAGRAGWVQATYITDDTEILAAKANERAIAAGVEYAKKATRFDKLKLPEDVARKLKLLKVGLTLAAPSNPKDSEEVTRLQASMEGTYGKGKYCPQGKEKCLDLQDITKIMAESRDAGELLDVWRGWHSIAVPIRPEYTRFVELANKGARELGFADTGAMWRAKYDMPPDDISREVDRLWEQVRPLYVSLHTYVRSRLRTKYGNIVPADGPIPAHLLGNIWAQDWSNVMALVEPPSSGRTYVLDDILKQRKMTAEDMVRAGERFYTSIGFAPLPQTFWERSLFTKPAA